MRPPSTTSPAIAASVNAAAMAGSHHEAAPMAIRAGMAMGAAMGSHEMARAQAVSGLPMAAKDTKYTRTSRTLMGPATLCASSGRDASDPRAPNKVA